MPSKSTIYRLARTTPYIGGQVRVDIVLHQHDDGNTYADEVHVVPLSDNIVFNEGNSWKTLNYSHEENIKHLYDTIGNTMFECVPERNGDKWLYDNDGIYKDTIDHTYCAGVRRMRYQRYGKQFSVLTPVWMYGTAGDFSTDKIFFDLCVYNNVDQYTNASYRVMWSDAVKKYLDDYLKTIDNQLLNINFDTYSCYIDGIHAPSGVHLNKEVNYLLTNMLLRERPLMEFDYLISETFMQNGIVAKQLVNFNFVFNLEDILPPHYDEYNHRDMTIVSKVLERVDSNDNNGYDYIEFPTKDIYTNYELVPSAVFTEDITGVVFTDEINVLDYKHDNACIDTIYDNKAVQPLCHWSMESADNVIFNMYNGFSPVCVDSMAQDNKVIKYRTSGRYYGTPDLTLEPYNTAAFNINWCYVRDMREHDNASLQISNDTPATYFGNVYNGITYVNGVKYDYSKIGELITDDTKMPEDTYVNNVLTHKWYDWNIGIAVLDPDDVLAGLTENQLYLYTDNDWQVYTTSPVGNNTNIILIEVQENKRTMWIRTDNVDLVTFSNIHKAISYLYVAGNVNPTILNSYLKCLYGILLCAQKPHNIHFTTSVAPYYTAGPKLNDTTTTEIEYYTDNTVTVDLYRYSDRLVPTFIDPADKNFYNYTYRYDQWKRTGDGTEEALVLGTDDDEVSDAKDGNIMLSVSEYNKYLNTGYTPYYPSVGYFSLVRREYRTYDEPDMYFAGGVKKFPEVCWYDLSVIVNMLPVEIVELHDRDMSQMTDEQLIESAWDALYNRVWNNMWHDIPDEQRDMYMDYLKKIYGYKIKQEYTTLTDVNRYDYVFTFSLY